METSLLIFKGLQRLLGDFILFILSYRVWLASIVLSCHMLFLYMSRTRASVSMIEGKSIGLLLRVQLEVEVGSDLEAMLE